MDIWGIEYSKSFHANCKVPKGTRGKITSGFQVSSFKFRAVGVRSTLETRNFLLDFQHPVQRRPSPKLYIISDLDLINDIAFHHVLQRPAEVLRGDTEHGGAKAAGVIQGNDFLSLRRELLAHAVYQMNFGSHGKAGARRSFANHFDQPVGRADA